MHANGKWNLAWSDAINEGKCCTATRCPSSSSSWRRVPAPLREHQEDHLHARIKLRAAERSWYTRRGCSSLHFVLLYNEGVRLRCRSCRQELCPSALPAPADARFRESGDRNGVLQRCVTPRRPRARGETPRRRRISVSASVALSVSSVSAVWIRHEGSHVRRFAPPSYHARNSAVRASPSSVYAGGVRAARGNPPCLPTRATPPTRTHVCTSRRPLRTVPVLRVNFVAVLDDAPPGAKEAKVHECTSCFTHSTTRGRYAGGFGALESGCCLQGQLRGGGVRNGGANLWASTFLLYGRVIFTCTVSI